MATLPLSPWPADLRPEGAPVWSRNELVIEASPEAVWSVLLRAGDWPSYYANARDVMIEGGAQELSADAVFTWRTFGIGVQTQVTAFEPARVLAWRGDSWLGRGFHTWLFEPVPEGCRLVTEEVQRGWLPWVARAYLRPGLLRWHQRWLEGLADQACGRKGPA